MVGSDKGVKLPVQWNFACSAFSASFAEAITLPLDMAKVRLQVQNKAVTPPQYTGLLQTVFKVAKDEGAGALWKGIEPGIHRQIVNGGLRLGLYDPIKTAIGGDDGRFEKKVAAGLLSGGIAISIANPTDLVKVRMQAEGKRPAGEPKRYRNAFHAYYKITAEEGFFSLWRGVAPNIARNAIINAAELASYDQIKQSLLATGFFQDNVVTHLFSGLGAGFFAVVCGSPVDVVKSRIMADKKHEFKGIFDCFAKTLAKDGILAFYNGFFPNFVRLGSWNVIMFLTLEQTKLFMHKTLYKE